MELIQLEAFLAVVREGSFTKAAERLNLTQPSLSARIRQLEISVKGELFIRDSRPTRLSALGEIFLPYIERSLTILSAGQEALRTAQLGLAGRVLVGCTFSVSTSLMPQVIRVFNQRFPQAELFIDSGHSNFVVNQLLDGLVNLGFAAAFPNLLLQTQLLLRLHDEMIVAVAPGHPLAGTRNVPLDLVWQYRPILIHWGEAFDAHVESLRQLSMNPRPVLRIPLAVALPMTRRIDTVTFMPRRLAAAAELAEVHVPGLSFPWDVALITRPGRVLTITEQALVTIVSEVWEESKPAPLT